MAARGRVTYSPLFFIIIQRNAIQLQPFTDNRITEISSDFLLQRFQRFVLELNDFAVSVNDVMAMPVAVLGGLEAGTTVSEIVALKDLRFFKKMNRPVHGRHADAIFDLDGALMKFLGIRMIIGRRKYLQK